MKISARNTIKGKVVEIVEGAVMELLKLISEMEQ